MRNFKNLDEQRQNNEKQQAQIKNRFMMRVVVAVIAMFMILSSYRSIFIGFLMLSPLLIVAAWFVFVYLKKKRGQNEADSPSASFFDLNPKSARTERNAQEYQTIAENNYDYCTTVSEHDHVSSKNYNSNDAKVVDSWDIKDTKPPWEL